MEVEFCHRAFKRQNSWLYTDTLHDTGKAQMMQSSSGLQFQTKFKQSLKGVFSKFLQQNCNFNNLYFPLLVKISVSEISCNRRKCSKEETN